MLKRRKRKTLPKNFEEMLENAPLVEQIAVFEVCDLEATGGYSKSTALGFDSCPDDLVRWLVAHGADVNAGDTYRRTPLHSRAESWRGGVELLLDLGASIEARDYEGCTPLHAAAQSYKPESVRILILRGADVHAEDDQGRTPLGAALETTANADIEHMAVIGELLLAAGDRVTGAMRDEVARIGREFEFHRTEFSPEHLPATEAGLAALYRLFEVEPAQRRRVHDGVSPILVEAVDWPAQHQELWELLVPSQGAAATAQGEAIRITGRVSREILDNGSANWDSGFRAMLAALVTHLGSGVPLSDGELSEAGALAAALRSGDGDDETGRLVELAVRWVLSNPDPIPLGSPGYQS